MNWSTDQEASATKLLEKSHGEAFHAQTMK